MSYFGYNRGMANFFIKRKKLTVPPIDRQAERIVELKQEIERLNVELERYRARENEISRSLLVAKELAERYERETKIRYALEAERLANYQKKWQLKIKKLNSAEDLGKEILNMQRYFRECYLELNALAQGEEVECDEVEESLFLEERRLASQKIDKTTQIDDCLSSQELDMLMYKLYEKKGGY